MKHIHRLFSIPLIIIFILHLTSFLVLAIEPGALPSGGEITSGSGKITSQDSQMTVNQYSDTMVADWDTFNIGAEARVDFVQPGSSSVAVNRIFDASPSQILGGLSANGQIFLLNSAGIIFGQSSQVDVGGLVASSLDLADADFQSGNFVFESSGLAGDVVNYGKITGGYVAFLSPHVVNEGTISADAGTVALVAADKVNLAFADEQLINFTVDNGAVDALAENSGLIKADGGVVFMTAEAADELTNAVVNNEGVIEAQTIAERNGRILLLSDMEYGKTIVDGTLDASAPNGGDGGFIETSAATVNIKDTVKITTHAIDGEIGEWLIDPVDITVDSSGDDISGATIATALRTTNVTLDTAGTGSCTGASCDGSFSGTDGDITINDNISVSGGSADTTLTFKADRNIFLNSGMSISRSDSNKLNVVFWADSDATGGGMVWMKPSSSITSNGGDVTLAGGADDGSNGGTASDGIPDGFAQGLDGVASQTSGIWFQGTTITSGGGDVTIRGQGAATGNVLDALGVQTNMGIYADVASGDGLNINSGTGKISLYGVSQETSGINAQGISWISGKITSANTESDAITIVGDASTTNNTGWAMGVDLRGTIQTTAGGGITITGTGGTTDGTGSTQANGVVMWNLGNVLSSSGAITITGTVGSTVNSSTDIYQPGYLGQKSGTDVTSSSSNITLNADTLTLHANDRFASTGTLTIQPRTADTTIGLATTSYDLDLPASYFSTNFVSGFSGIVIGNTSAGDITVAASVSYSDPLTLKTAGNIEVNAGATLTGAAAGGDGISSSLIFWADSDGNSIGGIGLPGTSGSLITINTNGGGIWMGGGDGTASWTPYSGADTLTVGDDYAADYLKTGERYAGVYLKYATLTTSGGNIKISGKTVDTSSANGHMGVYIADQNINSGSGQIIIDGQAAATVVVSDVKGVEMKEGGNTGTITTSSADTLMITGTNATSNSHGVDIGWGQTISATGSGGITITGSTTGSGYDLSLADSTNAVLSATGAITLSGSNMRLSATYIGEKSGSSVTSSNSAITIVADSLFMDVAAPIAATGGSGTLTIKPSSAARTIGLAGGSGDLNISAAEWGYIQDGFSSVTIGSSTAGAITVGGTPTFQDSTTLQTNSTITIGGAVTAAANLAMTSAGAITQTAALDVTGTTTITAGSANDVTLTNASNDFAGAVSVVSGNDVSLRDTDAMDLGASTVSGNLMLQTGGALTQSGALDVTGTTSITAGTNAVTLANTNNDFTGAVSVVSAQNLQLVDSNAMSLGAVNSTGTVDIATLTGDLTLTGAVATTNTGSSAITLNAGKSTAAGTATGGDIVVSGASLSVDSGGRATLYSGDVSDSAGLTALIGSASGNFRYNSDEDDANYVTSLGSGNYAIYREQPAVTITANDDSQVYSGSAYSGGNGVSVTSSDFVNGDTAVLAFSGTVSYSGSSQGATDVGGYVITPGGYTSLLGYAASYTNGTLTITAAPDVVDDTGTNTTNEDVNNIIESVVSVQQFVNGTQENTAGARSLSGASNSDTKAFKMGPGSGSNSIDMFSAFKLVEDRTQQSTNQSVFDYHNDFLKKE